MKQLLPLTSSQRHTILINRKYLWKCDPFKQLTYYRKNTAGRNNTGRITVFHRGSGHKKKIRLLIFTEIFLEFHVKFFLWNLTLIVVLLYRLLFIKMCIVLYFVCF